MSKTIQKTARFKNVLADFEKFLPQAEAAFRKLAEDESQGPKEHDVAVADADGEVAELLPGGTKPGTESPPSSNAENDAGIVPSVEGSGLNPPEEHHETHEQSPSAKVASTNFDKLAASLLLAAGAGTPKTAEAAPTEGTGTPNPKTASADQEGELTPAEVDSLTRKIACAQADAAVGRTLADLVLSGFAQHARKVAAAEADAELIQTAVHNKVAEMRRLGWDESKIGNALEEMGRIDGANFKIAEGGLPPELMAGGEDPGAMGGEGGMPPEGAMEGPPGGMPPGAEGGMPGGEGGDLPPELQEIVSALVEMIQSGEVSPEDAIEAAQIIDQQLGIDPGQGGAPPEGGGGPPQEGPPQEGGEPDGDEGPPKEGGGEKPEPKEEGPKEDEKQKEARFHGIGVGIRYKVAERRCRGIAEQVFGGRMYPARKVAAMVAMGEDLEVAASYIYHDERRKVAENDLAVPQNTPEPQDASLEDVFTLLDSLVAAGTITEDQASAALEALTVGNDGSKVASLIHSVRTIVHGIKKADGEGMAVPPIDPAAGGAPPVDPAAGGAPAGPPPPGPADAPQADVNPQQAVEQLIGALEQLVQAGILTEQAAVQMLNEAGLGGAPPAGGAPPGGASPPPPSGDPGVAGPPAGAPPAGPIA